MLEQCNGMVVFVLFWCYGMVCKVKTWLCKLLMLNKHILLKLVILGLWLGSHLCIRVYYTLDGKEVID
jgi:hypothetical protein